MTFKELLKVTDRELLIEVMTREKDGTPKYKMHRNKEWREMAIDGEVKRLWSSTTQVKVRSLDELQEHTVDRNDYAEVTFTEDNYNLEVITFEQVMVVVL